MEWQVLIRTQLVSGDDTPIDMEIELGVGIFEDVVTFIQQIMHFGDRYPWFVTPHPDNQSRTLEEWAEAIQQTQMGMDVEFDVSVKDDHLEVTVR